MWRFWIFQSTYWVLILTTSENSTEKWEPLSSPCWSIEQSDRQFLIIEGSSSRWRSWFDWNIGKYLHRFGSTQTIINNTVKYLHFISTILVKGKTGERNTTKDYKMWCDFLIKPIYTFIYFYMKTSPVKLQFLPVSIQTRVICSDWLQSHGHLKSFKCRWVWSIMMS